MKLLPSGVVVVYSTTECRLYELKKPSKFNDILCADQTPFNFQQLELLQQKITINYSDARLCVVVVPDNWVSVTQHQINHHVPVSLRPLAALTFAAENTFEAPAKLQFRYRYTQTEQQCSTLDVIACAKQRVELFCAPFEEKYEECLLVTYAQWESARNNKYSWRWLTKESLRIYNPDFEDNRSNKKRLCAFFLLSLLINLFAYFYFNNINQAVSNTQLAYQQSEASLANWVAQHSDNRVLELVLEAVRKLPNYVRVSAFLGGPKQISVVVTLPQKELGTILALWQEQYPEWLLETEILESNTPFQSRIKGVVDAVISITKD